MKGILVRIECSGICENRSHNVRHNPHYHCHPDAFVYLLACLVRTCNKAVFFQSILPHPVCSSVGDFCYWPDVWPDSYGQLATLLELSSMTWFGTLLLMTVALLAADIVTGFGLFMSHQIVRLRGLALLVGIALTITALIQAYVHR